MNGPLPALNYRSLSALQAKFYRLTPDEVYAHYSALNRSPTAGSNQRGALRSERSTKYGKPD